MRAGMGGGCCLVLFALAAAGAAPGEEADEIPLIGRPADLPFSEASAGFAPGPGKEYQVPFRVHAHATPTELPALSALTFTVTVEAAGTVRRPPRRINLRQMTSFDGQFHVEDVGDGKKEQVGPSRWRWVYRLRPKGARSDEIPGVPFVFYNPDLQPVEKGFQVIYTDPIPLRILSEERLTVPADAPDEALRWPEDGKLLAAVHEWAGPGPVLWAVAALLPPAVCLAWYAVWRRLNPDAARRAQVRRSRAARRALDQLGRAAAAEKVARVLRGYLHERFDLTSAEPTPDEVKDLLAGLSLTEERVNEGTALLREVTAARFAPEPAAEADLTGRAREFILHLEESQCPPSS